MLLNCGVGKDSWESLGLQGDQTGQSWKKSALNIHSKDWCWSSNTLATWCKKLTYWKRLWCWERLKAGGEGDDIGWDGCMASPSGHEWSTWVDMSLNNLREMVKNREAWYAAVHWVAKHWTGLSDWKTTIAPRDCKTFMWWRILCIALAKTWSAHIFGQTFWVRVKVFLDEINI